MFLADPRLGLFALMLAVAPALACRSRARFEQPDEVTTAPPAPRVQPVAPSSEPKWDPPPSLRPSGGAPAALGTLSTPPMPDGGTVNGSPNGPRASALNAVVQSASPRLKSCLDAIELPSGRELQVSVHYAIEPSGKTSHIEVSGALPRGAINCMEEVVAGLQFPEFGGEAVENTFPFGYRRDSR